MAVALAQLPASKRPKELTRKTIVLRLALVAGTLHTCSTTSATATASTASSSPSSCSSTLLALSRSPSITEFVAIAPHVSALLEKMTLAVEPSATASVVLIVIAVSATLAPLALAVAAPPTRGRRSSDLLSANEVDSSSRSNRGEKGDKGTPLKERGAMVAARSTDS
ncbi:unnamed protein product [Closterium sp. NIES-54]